MKKINTDKLLQQDSKGVFAKSSDVETFIANDMQEGRYMDRLTKNNTEPDLQRLNETLESASELFTRNITRLVEKTQALAATSQRASGDVRKAADNLMSGLQKIEKQADFDKLERYTALLERASFAMTTLAKLEADGKLQKIAAALK